MIRAWQPEVVGIREVLHASFTEHAYPSHTHDTWTLLMVDDGVVAYDLDRHEHGALRGVVSVLPPGVPHDGRSVTAGGFRKRVLYVEPDVIGADLVGRAVDHPGIRDPALGDGIGHLHEVLAGPHARHLRGGQPAGAGGGPAAASPRSARCAAARPRARLGSPRSGVCWTTGSPSP